MNHSTTTLASPFEVLLPEQRWRPETEALEHEDYEKLLPPLVQKIREKVNKWREAGYPGCSDTSEALLKFWFIIPHPFGDGEFNFYFAQREAIESIIYLYEVAGSRDKYELMRYDSSGRISTGMFDEYWCRYVIKMATGTGKTKVLALVLVWAYFHKLYEADSPLSQNSLVIAPNIIVLNRIRKDFDGLKMFREEPFIPDNGFAGNDWKNDFQPTLHIQDELKPISEAGNIFLTNIHRVYTSADQEPEIEELLLGKKPKPDADISKGLDLGRVLRSDKIKDLLVLNDEAHHIHDSSLQWFKSIEDINNKLKLKWNNGLALQVDFTATPRKNDGSIFVQTVMDYPLVEAISQNVVKQPVLPDRDSRELLVEHDSLNIIERYQDHIHLGYLEWEKQYEELKNERTPVLFIMTNDTKEADKVAEYLESTYPLLNQKVLTIHTKQNGELKGEASTTKKAVEELETLRKAADNIDQPQSPYLAVMSVLMLREGWDVQNVTTIVGLRPYKSKSNILPEQTLGRGLRKMFALNVKEELVVVGTEKFIEFVEELKVEGVTFDYKPMGSGTDRKSALIIEVDKDNQEKNLEQLDIVFPLLSPRVYREYKDLDKINLQALPKANIHLLSANDEEIRKINFQDWKGDYSHTTEMGQIKPDYRNVIGFFTQQILKETKLVSGFSLLYPKVESYIHKGLFDKPVDPSDDLAMRNIILPHVNKRLKEIFKKAINELTISDKGTAEIRDYGRLTNARPLVTSDQPFFRSEKTVFNKVVGDNQFELRFGAFLNNKCPDIMSFAKNHQGVGFRMEYLAEDGNIRDYYPDFFVKRAENEVWIVETKGREDLNDLRKIHRLKTWCDDVNQLQDRINYRWLYVKQEDWEVHEKNLKRFEEVILTFAFDDKQFDAVREPWEILKRGADVNAYGDPVEWQQEVREDRPLPYEKLKKNKGGETD